ncbi:MAG: four helix bundle protein [Gemmatimonadales bacterium]
MTLQYGNSRKVEGLAAVHQLALAVYAATEQWPREERYGLTAQARRAAHSAAANIAEGWAKHGRRDLRRYLSISRGWRSRFGASCTTSAMQPRRRPGNSSRHSAPSGRPLGSLRLVHACSRLFSPVPARFRLTSVPACSRPFRSVRVRSSAAGR